MQAEALPPDALNALVLNAVERSIDLDIHTAVVTCERDEREQVLKAMPQRS